MRNTFLLLLGFSLVLGLALAEENAESTNLGGEAQKIDESINKKQAEPEKHEFQTEVNRLMKLIINSLYRNKDIFLRELISNASDALDKIRLLSLTIKNALAANPELSIRIKADKENKIMTITDTGIGMTKNDLINNLGTIAKSGTAEFLGKMQDVNSQEQNDMIGQFGVGFYSAFLVANKVTVASKHNDDKQYTWESDSSTFSITEDTSGSDLLRGTTVTLHMKDEAMDFVDENRIRELIKRYSQFINFPIYMWSSKTIKVEEEVEDEESEEPKLEEEPKDEDEDANVEVDGEEKEKKKKMVDKTVWDWELLNEAKPIWTQKPSDISEEEYQSFYKALTKDTQDALAKVHFIAEGEVSFKSLLYVPKVQPSDSFNRYGTQTDNIKLYVRRVFIGDKISDMVSNYLSFIRGIVDSDDLPLNVSRENLQQHKLIKIIKKKLTRKVLDMLKKLSKEDYQKFWKEYSTNIKLGVLEDSQNRARLSKLLMFQSSTQNNFTFLEDYVARMKPNQKHIYYIAGASKAEVEKSPFVERLNRKGYEILYLTEAVDEYCISSLPEFSEKKFQNIAKEGFTLDDSEKTKEKMEQMKATFEPLTKWLGEQLKDQVSKVEVSERLTQSPCALVASMFGWTGNMERLALSNAHQKADDPHKSHYLNQKKMMEINPRHPLIRELLRRVESDADDETAKETALIMFNTATLRSGYMLKETSAFADSIQKLLHKSLHISMDDIEEDEEEEDEPEVASEEKPESKVEEEEELHDEL